MNSEDQLDDLAPQDAEAIKGAGAVPPPGHGGLGGQLPEPALTSPAIPDLGKHHAQETVRETRDEAKASVRRTAEEILPDPS